MPLSARCGVLGVLGVSLLSGRPMARQVDVDPSSLMTTPVVLFNGAQPVSQGTGFFFASTASSGDIETVFLATNYHVVTGHEPLATAGRAGDHIRFWLHADPGNLEDMRTVDLPLYDDQGDPNWVASEVYPAADVVLVPIPPKAYEHVVKLFVFTEAHTRGDIKIRTTSGATLLGYPYGFYDEKHYLPIWKTGHVASEPDVDFDGKPVFLVDVSAFPGMSGSPVLAAENGVYEGEDGTMRSGRVRKLLGIFAAMPVAHDRRPTASGYAPDAASTDIPLQLGYVWKAALIADVARSYRPKR